MKTEADRRGNDGDERRRGREGMAKRKARGDLEKRGTRGRKIKMQERRSARRLTGRTALGRVHARRWCFMSGRGCVPWRTFDRGVCE